MAMIKNIQQNLWIFHNVTTHSVLMIDGFNSEVILETSSPELKNSSQLEAIFTKQNVCQATLPLLKGQYS